MSTYDDVLAVSKSYIGIVSDMFLGKVLKKMGKTKDDLTKADIPALAKTAESEASRVLKPERLAEYKSKLMALK